MRYILDFESWESDATGEASLNGLAMLDNVPPTFLHIYYIFWEVKSKGLTTDSP
jgi:hypothetical protein